ncbi:MAG TPA: hypothetical protein ENF38_01470 [Candidatus Aenigmarchaeota archaeon]|nr:hypothetical protein [Candidatus Aenigmarchaeota archaeon]
MVYEEIPPRLKKRWETFAEAVRYCWKEAKKVVEPSKDMLQFWECMEKRARSTIPLTHEEEAKLMEEVKAMGRLTKEMAKKCAELGYHVAPHPICVMRKVAEGLAPHEAVEKCLEEGKYHGISALRCEALLRERGLL